ncbi:MAG: restriction endonuclease subunit S [Deltaproteobacteria bacterium]|nr:MAG: restriction endonuclease subunit S [Deltaproteobacteria bacterium]
MRKKTINLYHLPGTWQLATIGELIGINGVFVDGDWVESKDQDQNGDVRLIQLADIGDGIFRDKSARFLRKNKAYELRCTFLQNGDILIARMPEPLGRACIFPLIGEEKYVTVVDVCIVRPAHNDISNKYLTYAINSPQIRHEIDKYKTGSTRKRISRKNLARVNLPIAPLPEQHRIVAKIEQLFSKLDKGVAELKKAKEKLELYRQSLLKAAFEGRLTEQWRKKHADELPACRDGANGAGRESAEELLARIKAEREKRYQQQLEEWKQAVKEWEVQGKPGKKPTKPRKPKELPPLTEEELAELPKLPEGWGYLHLGDILQVASGQGLTSAQMSGEGYAVYGGNGISGYHSSYMFEKEKLILGRVGAKCGVTHITRPKSWVTDNALVVEFLIDSIDIYFMKFWLSYENLNKLSVSTAQPVISGAKIYPTIIALPSIEEQKEISNLIETQFSNIDQLEQTIIQSLQRSDLLRQSILKKAFSGKLVPQDPNDEPASELLKRIRAEREKVGATGRSPQRRRRK